MKHVSYSLLLKLTFIPISTKHRNPEIEMGFISLETAMKPEPKKFPSVWRKKLRTRVIKCKGTFQSHTQTLARDKRKPNTNTGIESTIFKMEKKDNGITWQLNNTSTIKGSHGLNWKWHSIAAFMKFWLNRNTIFVENVEFDVKKIWMIWIILPYLRIKS